VESSGFGVREKEAVLRDVANTQKAVQGLTRVANPLAHLMEYLQEDVEAMNKELEQWVKEKNQCNQTLQMQQK
jgi:TRAF3-interacting protein 1